MESGVLGNKKIKLQIYLSELIVEDSNDFDILRWWKFNSERSLILSKLAKGVLVVPIFTVTPEYVFIIIGRVLDSFRRFLTPKIVEILVCI